MEECYEISLVVLLKYKFNFSEFTAFGETCRRQPCQTFTLHRGQPIKQVTLKKQIDGSAKHFRLMLIGTIRQKSYRLMTEPGPKEK